MKVKKGLKRLLSAVLMLCMVLGLCMSVLATAPQEGNSAVDQDKEAILQVRVGVKMKDTNEILPLITGTGFLINDEHLVTCSHVLDFENNKIPHVIEGKEKQVTIYKALELEFGYTKKQADERKVIQVSVYRDVQRPVDVVFESEKTDLALLKLKTPLQNMKKLEICPEDPVTTAPCYALGFPGLTTDSAFNDIKTYTPEDVTVTGGLVNKLYQKDSVQCIAFSATTGAGGSGGPVVNYDGQVMGIVSEVLSEDGSSKDFMNAVNVIELRKVLDRLGIVYVLGNSGGNVAEPAGDGGATVVEQPPADTRNWDALNSAINNAGAYESSTGDYKDAEAKRFTSALSNARSLKGSETATQGDIDAAAEELKAAQTAMLAAEKPKTPWVPIIIGALAALIILIILIVLLSGRNKDKGRTGSYDVPEPGIPPYTPPTPGPAFGEGPAYGGAPAPGTTVLGGGGTETTVLGGDSSATTVLSGAASYGTLTRTKTGEKITISRDQFKIGRERSRVDYCISDNTAVGRLHAIIVSRGGSTYVVDQNSTNCTFVNSVRATANQEVRLNSGDKITFADEEFTFNAF